MYILVRKDLSPSQQVVQACHAVAESARTLFGCVPEHPHFVVCAVKDETSLIKALNKIRLHGVRCVSFSEADLNGQMTAIASEPVYGDERLIFRNYQLLKIEQQTA